MHPRGGDPPLSCLISVAAIAEHHDCDVCHEARLATAETTCRRDREAANLADPRPWPTSWICFEQQAAGVDPRR